MGHVCPECDGANVRRLATRTAERTWRNSFYSRYRCRDCLHEFWAFRRKIYTTGATMIGSIVVAILIATLVLERMYRR